MREKVFSANADWDRLWDLLTTRGRVENYELPIRAADGQSVWLSISLATFPSLGLAEGVMVDITEKRAAAEQIREQAELLEKTLTSMSDGVLVLDPSGRTLFANPACKALFGDQFEIGSHEWQQYHHRSAPTA